MSLEDIQFDEAELDSAILEIGIDTALPQETQRAIAAISMVAFSLAMAIKDEDQYLDALCTLRGMPEDEEEVRFLGEFSRALAADLESEFDKVDMDITVFSRRAEQFAQSASYQCH